MATRFVDSCSLENSPQRLYVTGNNGAYINGKGRFGLPGLQPSGGNHLGMPTLPDNPSTIFTAFAASPSNTNSNVPLIGLYDTASLVDQVGLSITVGGILTAYRGGNGSGGTLIATASGFNFIQDGINHFEVKWVIDAAAGVIQVRLNGDPNPILTFAGNTKASANAFFNQIRLYPGGIFSDIHVFDATNPTGNDPHDFLGNKRIYTLDVDSDTAPNDGMGTPAQGAGNHHLNVDEFPPNDDTDYLALTAGQKETFGFQNLPANTSGISQVGLFPRWRVDDAQPHTARVNCISGASTANGTTKNPPATYKTETDGGFFPVNPNGGGVWNAAGVNGMNGQVEVQT